MLAHECFMRNPRQTCDKQPFCDCEQCVEKIVQEAMDYLIRPTQQQQQQQQGLYKGSTTTSTSYELTGSGPHHRPAERPKTLRRLKRVYDPSTASTVSTTTTTSSSNGAGGVAGDGGGDALAILSPFDEQEEWAKISEIMASFGTGLVRESVFVTELEKEFQERLVMTRSESRASDRMTPVGVGPTGNMSTWLHSLNLSEYESLLVNNGYDHLEFINGVLEDADLREIGVDNEADRKTILEAVRLLPKRLPLPPNTMSKIGADAVDTWLQEIQLQCYQETFQKHLYTDMMRVGRIWEVELTAVLEIQKVGHRKRILASVGAPPAPPTVARSQQQQQQPTATATTAAATTTTNTPAPKLEQLNADLHQLSNIQQLKEDIRESNKMPVSNSGTLRHSHKKNRPAPPPPVQQQQPQPPPVADLEIREPSELLVGVPATLTTQWRHQPEALVQGHIKYQAQYLGSTLVKELRGTESTKKSIQKLKKSQKESNKTQTIPDILLAINHRGVRFINAQTQELVCEHEIRNIHCACQDADDLTHFAYITKDLTTRTHYCHVFCVNTMDQATEVILTLGQAFEVAYQLALKEQFQQRPPQQQKQPINQRTSGNGHIRSHSANLIPNLVTVPITTTTTKTTTGSNSNGSQQTAQQQHARSHSVNEIKINGSPLLQLAVNDNLNNALQQQSTSTVQQQQGQAPIAVSEEL